MSPETTRPFIPGYGVPDDLDGALPWAWAEERLARAYRYWIASTNADGSPHVRPVWGVWIAERLVFSTSPTNVTSRNLGGDARASASVQHDHDSVIVEGAAALGTVDGVGDAYAAKYGGEYEVGGDETPLWVLTPARVFGFVDDGSGFGRTATRWVF
jgi:hypothetical protein